MRLTLLIGAVLGILFRLPQASAFQPECHFTHHHRSHKEFPTHSTADLDRRDQAGSPRATGYCWDCNTTDQSEDYGQPLYPSQPQTSDLDEPQISGQAQSNCPPKSSDESESNSQPPSYGGQPDSSPLSVRLQKITDCKNITLLEVDKFVDNGIRVEATCGDSSSPGNPSHVELCAILRNGDGALYWSFEADGWFCGTCNECSLVDPSATSNMTMTCVCDGEKQGSIDLAEHIYALDGLLGFFAYVG